MKRFLSSSLSLLLAATAMAAPVKFELILNNDAGSIVAAEHQSQGTEFDYGLAVADDGTVTRVAPDAAEAVAHLTGSFYNEHGSSNVVLTLPVDGPMLVTVGACSYGSHTVTLVDAEGNESTFDTQASCWKNDHSQVAKGYYKGGATTLTVKGTTYMPYLAVESVDELPATVTVTYSLGTQTAEGTVPAAAEVGFQEDYAIAPNFTLYKAGFTLTGWNDGKTTYKTGEIIRPETDLTLTPVFKANGNDISVLHNATTIVWDFQRDHGAPTLAAEGTGKNFWYVAQANVDGEIQDVAMYCDVEAGKIANGNWGDWAQINGGTRLTIPSAKDATVTVESYQATTTTTFNGHAAEGNTETVYTYTEADDVNACEIVIGDGSYYRTFTAVLPANYVAPEGDKYDNVPLTLTWAVGDEKDPVVSDDLNMALTSTGYSVGTDLEVSGPNSYNLAAEGTVGPYVVYRPNTGNAGYVETDMIEYTVKVKKGLTFTPTSVAFDAVKEGTDNAYFSWSYTVDGVEGPIVDYDDPKSQIRRNNDANPSAPLTHIEAIDAEGGRTFTLRFYISTVANNKKMAIGNVRISGKVNGEAEVRAFQDFKLDFRTDPYVVTEPASGVLPVGVTVEGAFHDGQHGYTTTVITVPCDGPVKFTFGSCQYSGNSATVVGEDGQLLATIDCNVGCDSNTSCDKYVTWYYNSEDPQTLTITTAQYIPFFYAEACDLLPMVNVTYYDTDGKTLLGQETVQGGSSLVFSYGEADVTVDEGQKFRGWFNSTQTTAVKIAEGTMLQDDLKLYAKATAIEVPTSTSRFIYDLTKPSFYVEDHEAIEIDGFFHDGQHGWQVNNGGAIRVYVAGKAYVSLSNCVYSAASEATVTGEDGVVYDTFKVNADTDGAEYTFQYDGPAQWLSITFPNGSYTHSVKVSNVVDFIEFDEATGYYSIAPGDVSSFLIALSDANGRGDVKIFLPNGVYDLGETALTPISGNNISIIGESMMGTIIRNAPAKENEGIGTTATLLNTSDGLYLQDLTIQNALDYYATGAAGRAVCLQDKGKNTIAKNVRMLSYQDTYYSNAASRFYWEDCEIHGTVDYLCGDGDVVYNRVKLVNESRARDVESGECTVCAPYTSAICQWGYVFLDCQIETLSKSFNFGRSWGGESKAQYLRTVDLDGKLVASRFTAAGMNVAAYRFKEYQTMDAEGNITTPESNEMTFTHTTGNFTYETVMTDDEAAQYTLENIYGEWAPDQTAAQVVPTEADFAQPEADALYLVDGVICMGQIPADAQLVRKANSRGGFGPAVEYVEPVSVEQVEAPAAEGAVVYNLFGQRTATANGICIVNGQKVVR